MVFSPWITVGPVIGVAGVVHEGEGAGLPLLAGGDAESVIKKCSMKEVKETINSLIP